MSDSAPRAATTAAIAIACVAIVLQIAPLFWGRSFYLDWINHAWITQYYADHLRQFGSFPGTIDAKQAFGNPAPLFYGVFFYPIVSLIAELTGADAALKILAVVVLALPVLASAMFLNSCTKNWPASLIVATIFNSSVYQLTNLYARSALTEFFANQFLLLGIPLLIHGLISKSKTSAGWISLGVAFVTIAMGTHPVTVYALAPFLTPMTMLALVSLRSTIGRPQIIQFGIALLLLIIAICPWLINVLANQAMLQISTTNILAGSIHYFPFSIDSFFGRIGYFYFDSRVATDGIDATSTPFLDAPFSIVAASLLLFAYFHLSRTGRGNVFFLIIPTVLAMVAILIVAHPPRGIASGLWPSSVKAVGSDGQLYKLLIPIQFAYRLAGTWSMVLTTAAMFGFAALSISTKSEWITTRRSRSIAVAIVLISTAGLAQKLAVTNLEYRIYPAAKMASGEISVMKDSDKVILLPSKQYKSMINDTSRYPSTFLSQLDYSIPATIPKTHEDTPEPKIQIDFTTWNSKELASCLAARCLVHTNILPSPTNRVDINGSPATGVSLSSLGTLDVSVPSGSHQIEVSRVGKKFAAAQISIWFVLAWVALSVFYTATSLLRNRHHPMNSSPGLKI